MKSCWEEDVVEKALEMYRSAPFQQHLYKKLTCVEASGDKENVKNVNNDNKDGNDDDKDCHKSKEGNDTKSRCMVGRISVEEQCLIALGKMQIVNALIRFEEKHCSIKDQFGVTLSKETQKFLKSKWEELSSNPSSEWSVMQFSKNTCAVYGCEIDVLPIKCERCKSVFYCSKAHQVAHMAVHIPICSLLSGAKVKKKQHVGTTKCGSNNTHANRKSRTCSCGHKACRRYCLYFKKPEITVEQKIKRELKRLMAFKGK